VTTSRPAALAERGVIEGFYGRPFSHQERLDLLRFIGARGFNCFVYAPKNDPRHRDRWREPYAPDELARFAELARVAGAHGVRFLYAIAPGLSYDAADEREFALLEAKVRALLDAGARGIALLFDDLTADSSTLEPRVQAELVARTADLVTRVDRDAAFWFIGNFYCGDVAELRRGTGFWTTLYGRAATDYFAAYDALVPPSVPIMWTGPGVFSAAVRARDTADFCALARRPVVLWDNFPVNDALSTHLFLGPYVGREPQAIASLHGVVLNLMSQPCANQIPLATASDFFADLDGYDPDASLRRAVAALVGEGDAATHLEAFVAQHRGHPVLAADATAPELRDHIAAAFAATSRDEARALLQLREHLDALANNEAQLRRALAGHALLADVEPWSQQLTRLARAALAGVDALRGAAPRGDYEAARDLARRYDHVVASTRLPSPLLPFVAGQGIGVDRFADLFAAIEQRLTAAGSQAG
jgi:hyaluronoglucosaminidase